MEAVRGFRKQIASVTLGALSLAAMAPAAAENLPAANAFDGQWHFSVTPYAWLPTIYDSATINPRGITDGVQSNSHVTPGDYLSHLSFAFFLAGEARKGDWSVFADYNYVKFTNASTGLKPISRVPGAPPALPYDSSESLKANILTLGGGYTAWRKGASHMDVLAGARYLNMGVTLDYSLFGVPRELEAATSMNKWDVIAGIKGQVGLSDDGRWFMPYYADIGTGSNNWTWMAMIGTGYRYNWGDVTLALRSLSYNFTGRGDSGIDMRMTGVALGATFPF